MKLFALEKQVQITYHIHLSNLHNDISKCPYQKHLTGIVLESKLSFNAHVDQYSYLDFPSQINYSLRSVSASFIKRSLSRTKFFKTCFPYCINEWSNLTVEIRNSKSVSAFKKLIKCKKEQKTSIFSIYDPLGVKLLTRLRLQFSHLNEHKFRHGFGDTISAMCARGSEVETTEHFLLRCHLYCPQRLELFENLEKVDSSFLNSKVKEKVSFLSYGPKSATSKN